MIHRVSFNSWDFHSDEKLRNKFADVLNRFEIPHPINTVEYGSDNIFYRAHDDFFKETYLIDVAVLLKEQIPFRVGSFSNEESNLLVGNSLKIVSLTNKLNELLKRGDVASNVTINFPDTDSRYLRDVTDVKVLDDCCTDSLQKRLDEGWRILAILPQPHQRRPDYVMGKTKEEGE